MATLIAVWFIGAAVSESRAASQATAPTDVVETSRPSVNIPARTAVTMRFDDAQTFASADARNGAASQAPISGLIELPLAARFMPASDPVEGIASTYNPQDRSDRAAGGAGTASGEKYDPQDWSAAIRIDMRDKFGLEKGSSQSTYALVESADKRLIVKINDVGTLRPGRIIDLNVRAMRYFDPSLELGLIKNVKVTPLVGKDMAPGPVENNPPTNFAGWFG